MFLVTCSEPSNWVYVSVTVTVTGVVPAVMVTGWVGAMTTPAPTLGVLPLSGSVTVQLVPAGMSV
jgi:hypothetical protein